MVYGQPALVAGIDLGLKVRLEKSEKDEYLLDQELSKKQAVQLRELVYKARELVGASSNYRLMIKGNLPIGSGMGSSAVVCAGLIKELARIQNMDLDKQQWFERSWECEKIVHGNSSGVDPAAVVFGGIVLYRKHKPMKFIKKLECPYEFLIIQTGRPEESTKEMVELVKKRLDEGLIDEQLLKKMGMVTGNIVKNMKGGEDVVELVNENGFLLEELGVVSKTTKKLSNALRNEGLGVKVSGAGGVKNGSGILLVCGNIGKAESLLKKQNHQYWQIKVG